MSSQKINLTPELLKRLVEEIETGFRCFVDVEKNEIKSVIDFEKHPLAEEEMWIDDVNEVEENPTRYIEIELPDTRYNFQIMEDFVGTVKDASLQRWLYQVLSMKKPFTNFKQVIHGTGKEREDWFAFRTKRLEEWAVDQVNRINQNHNEQS